MESARLRMAAAPGTSEPDSRGPLEQLIMGRAQRGLQEPEVRSVIPYADDGEQCGQLPVSRGTGLPRLL